MKCGSCRDKAAKSYTKVDLNDKLLVILKKMNPNLAYNAKNSYFCSACIDKATVKLSHELNEISDQNPHTITTLNLSTLTTTTNSDENDVIVASKIVFGATGTPLQPPPQPKAAKRPAPLMENTQRPRPGLKCSKKRLAGITEASRVEVASSQQTSEENRSGSQLSIAEVISSEQKSSELNSEYDILLDIDDDASSSHSSHPLEAQVLQSASNRSHSLPNKEMLNPRLQTTIPGDIDDEQPQTPARAELPLSKDVPSPQNPSDSKAVTNKPKASAPSKPRPKILHQDDVDSDSSISSNQREVQQPNPALPNLSNDQLINPVQNQRDEGDVEMEGDDVEHTVGAPSAPPVRRPRTRNENSNLAPDLRQYFSTRIVNVNNYSRNTAG